MSYCVNCGVKLKDTEEVCPLCETPVINPSAPQKSGAGRSYPPAKKSEKLRRVRRRAIADIFALMLLIPLLTTIICDINLGGGITWSIYVVISIGLLYTYLLPPMLLKRQVLTLSLVIDMFSTLAFLFVLNLILGQKWFLPFAFPVTLILFALTFVAVFLVNRSPWNILKIIGTILYLMGIFIMLIEWLLNLCFFDGAAISWAWYIFIPCMVLGSIMFIIDTNPYIKAALHKRFFI